MLKQHPLSAAFPAMSESEFQELKDSIMEIGVQNPITLFEGMVLDGWNRYRAAQEMESKCPSVELGDVDPRDFVLAQNKARRHVTQAQLAMATTAVYAWMPVGKPTEANSALSAELPTKTTKELAAVAGVGVRSIEQAKAVQTNAAPEVVAAVKSGAIGLPKAAAIAQLPKEQQAAAISKPLKPKRAEPKEPTLAEQVRKETGADEFDEAEAEVQELRQGYLLVAEENQRLLDENAALKANGTTEEQEAAAALIAEMREQLRVMGLELDAVKVSRDVYMNENAQLKKQIKFYQRKLKESEA